ncbi:M20/M25/M40 family metallo-hydrolase [Ekhidna sp. To15]|uniref:M20/M25/M40 family metallo-hydrolase n=1 Tax=Ekhidna sp. To15 TaxID=3395267 RepID=UPI003F523A11
MNYRIILSLIFLIAISAIQAQLSKKEKQIISIISENNTEALEFLETNVNINSGTMNFEGIKATADQMDKAFQEIGMTTEWYDMPEEVNRAGHLFAENKGKKGKRLLLIGHLDTVFPKDSPFQKWVRQDSIVMGPGANDMKGGNVVMLYALKALQEAGVLKNTQIIVALHGDEEASGKPISESRKHIIEAAKRSDIALGFETSTGFNNATIARRGSSGWSLKVKGVRAHSSGIFNEQVGAGAIFEMSRILHQFYTDVKGEQYLTFNPGVILGGTKVDFDEVLTKGMAFGKTNVVAQEVVVKGGLRFITEDQKERAREKMRAIVANNLPNTSAEITFIDSYPAMPPTEGNKAILDVLSKVSEDMGHGKVEAWDPGRRGAADISFVAEYVDGVDGLGTMGRGAHTPDEYLDLRTFEALTQRAAILIYRLTR